MPMFKFEVENFKRIRQLVFELKNRITELSGKNGVGKSSALDALWVLLKGLSVAPAVPIRTGAEMARIKGTFGELIVERIFRRKGDGETTSTLTVSNPQGAVFPSPQRKLDDLIGEHQLDPLAFMGMKPDAQFNVLRKFVPGFDFDTNAGQRKAAFDKRTDINRDQKKSQAAADAIVIPPGTPAKPHDIAALSAEIEASVKNNADLEVRRSNRAAAVTRIADLRKSAADLVENIKTDADAIQKTANEAIADLQRQIDELNQRMNHVAARASIDMAENRRMRQEQAAQRVKDADDLQTRLDAAGEPPEPIPEGVLQAKRQAISTAQQVNQHVTNAARKTEHQAEANRLSVQADALTATISELDRARQEAIAKAHMPVDGLGFGDGVILFDGLPFSEASKGQQLRTSTAISFAMNPKMPLVWIRDGSLLDDESLAIVHDQAETCDGYVIIETVRAIGADAIVLEDGHIQGVEPVEMVAPTELATTPKTTPKKSPRKWQGPGAPTGEVA